MRRVSLYKKRWKDLADILYIMINGNLYNPYYNESKSKIISRTTYWALYSKRMCKINSGSGYNE